MNRSKALFVYSQPGPDEQHRRADCAEKVPEKGAGQKKQGIKERCGRDAQLQMDAACSHEKTPDYHDEARVIQTGGDNAPGGVEKKEIITASNPGKGQAKLPVMHFPMVF